RSRGRGGRAGAPRGRRTCAAPGPDSRSGRRATLLRLPVTGSGGGGISRAGPRQPESGAGRSAHHAGHLEQLARPPAGSLPGGDRRSRGGNHRGAQPPERRRDTVGRRPGGNTAAGGRGPAAGRAGVRPRDRRRRSLRELRRGWPVVTTTAPLLAPELAQAENYRKLLLSVAKDARVIIIKLADRLHNMRTLEHLDQEKRRRIALETREIYAPLAHRFGMAGVKAELEDLACKFLEPEDYRALARKVKARKSEREE